LQIYCWQKFYHCIRHHATDETSSTIKERSIVFLNFNDFQLLQRTVSKLCALYETAIISKLSPSLVQLDNRREEQFLKALTDDSRYHNSIPFEKVFLLAQSIFTSSPLRSFPPRTKTLGENFAEILFISRILRRGLWLINEFSVLWLETWGFRAMHR
jgi:hypothetical protein